MAATTTCVLPHEAEGAASGLECCVHTQLVPLDDAFGAHHLRRGLYYKVWSIIMALATHCGVSYLPANTKRLWLQYVELFKLDSVDAAVGTRRDADPSTSLYIHESLARGFGEWIFDNCKKKAKKVRNPKQPSPQQATASTTAGNKRSSAEAFSSAADAGAQELRAATTTHPSPEASSNDDDDGAWLIRRPKFKLTEADAEALSALQGELCRYTARIEALLAKKKTRETLPEVVAAGFTKLMAAYDPFVVSRITRSVTAWCERHCASVDEHIDWDFVLLKMAPPPPQADVDLVVFNK